MSSNHTTPFTSCRLLTELTKAAYKNTIFVHEESQRHLLYKHLYCDVLVYNGLEYTDSNKQTSWDRSCGIPVLHVQLLKLLLGLFILGPVTGCWEVQSLYIFKKWLGIPELATFQKQVQLLIYFHDVSPTTPEYGYVWGWKPSRVLQIKLAEDAGIAAHKKGFIHSVVEARPRANRLPWFQIAAV